MSRSNTVLKKKNKLMNINEFLSQVNMSSFIIAYKNIMQILYIVKSYIEIITKTYYSIN